MVSRSQPNIIEVLEELSGVIEAVRGDRDVMRVSGRIGDSQDVGVMGIDGFQELLKQTVVHIEQLEAELVISRRCNKHVECLCRGEVMDHAAAVARDGERK